MESDDLRRSVYFLTGMAIVGAAYFFGARKSHTALERIRCWVQQEQKRLADIQEVLEKSKQLFERGRELFEDSRNVASQGWRIVRTGRTGESIESSSAWLAGE